MEGDSYEARGALLLDNAPAAFMTALQTLNTNENSIAVFAECIPLIEEGDPEWSGAAYACLAYCLKDAKDYKNALIAAGKAKERGINLIGMWYYHDAVVTSYNFLDDLSNALIAAEQAVEYFSSESSVLNLADHLFRKANILKQIASPLSFAESSRQQAKAFILSAIESACESLVLMEMDNFQEDEITAMARIASRLDITEDDLQILQRFRLLIPEVINRYFAIGPLRQRGVYENFNMSVEARKHGDRARAAVLLQRAFDLSDEDNEEDRAMKALIAYQHGVNLLQLHQLETYNPRTAISSAQHAVAEEIRRYWNECLRLYATLSVEKVRDFKQRLADLRHAVEAINSDRLMR